MNSIKKFTSFSEFNDYIRTYMLVYKLEQAYVSLRYSYTKEEMEKEDFKIQVCRIVPFYELRWLIDWWKGQEFIELQGIISPEIVRLLSKFEDAELLGKLTKEN